MNYQPGQLSSNDGQYGQGLAKRFGGFNGKEGDEVSKLYAELVSL